MKKAHQNPTGEDNYGATIASPRFNEEAEATARPVVPLAQVNGTDFYKGSARGPRVTRRPARNMWGPALIFILALAAMAATMTALYRSNETTVPSDSTQTISETTSAVAAEAPTEPSIHPERDEASNASTKVLRASDGRGGLSVRYEAERADSKEEERRERDEGERDEDDGDNEKLVERARKEEKKLAKRRRKEAEELAERQRDSEKRGGPKPRLVGIYTERP